MFDARTISRMTEIIVSPLLLWVFQKHSNHWRNSTLRMNRFLTGPENDTVSEINGSDPWPNEEERRIRVYNNKPVSKNVLDSILEAAKFAPTARNLQELEYKVITNKDLTKKISERSARYCHSETEISFSQDERKVEPILWRTASDNYYWAKGKHLDVFRRGTCSSKHHAVCNFDWSSNMLHRNGQIYRRRQEASTRVSHIDQ